jgi:large subunit ribosomal protein L29
MINKKQNSSNLSKMRSEVVALKRNMMNLKFQKSTGQLEKTAEIKKTRLKIARIKTNMNQILGDQDA